MSEAIKALIAAAEAFAESHQGCTCWSRDDYAELALFRDAIAAAKAAAEARPKPKPVRHCAKCGKPENAHDARHPFVGTGEPIRPEPKPDSAARDWPEDFADENGNYSVLCSICQQWFLGYKRRVACKVCATKEARPEPAAEPSDAVDLEVAMDDVGECLMSLTNHGDGSIWRNAVRNSVRSLRDAVEALAREVRK